MSSARSPDPSPQTAGDDSAPPIPAFVVIDIETSGLDFDADNFRILEVAACRVEPGQPVSTFQTLVREDAQLLTERLPGVTDDEVRSAVGEAEALAILASFCGLLPVVAHNGTGYDFPILGAALKRHSAPPIVGQQLDSLELALLVAPRSGRRVPPNIDGAKPPESLSLDSLCGWLAVAPPEPRHRALPDAAATARVVVKMLALLNQDRPEHNAQRFLLHRGHHPWAAFLTASDRLSPLEELVPAPPDGASPTSAPTSFSVDAAVSPLSPGGMLVRAPDRSHRPQQEQMARYVAGALAGGRTALIEAPTGTGKTLGYLVPAVAFARCNPEARVGVSMHTKILQDQVMVTLMELKDTLGPLRWTVLKGASNYLSLPDLADEMDDPPSTPEGSWALAAVVGWAAQTPTGEWDDLQDWLLRERSAGFPALRWRISCEGTRAAPTALDQKCFHHRAVMALNSADIAVLNHAVLLSRASVANELTHLVCDEAHNLEESATSALTEEVSEASLERLLDVIGATPRRGLLRRYRDYHRRADDSDLAAIAESVHLVTDCTEACRLHTGSFGSLLVEYARSRAETRTGQLERYGVQYRLRPGFDTGRGDYRPVRRAAESLAGSLEAIANNLDRLHLPTDCNPTGRRRRLNLEAQIVRASREARRAATCLRSGVGTHDDDRWISVAALEMRDDAISWALRRLPIDVSEKLQTLWGNMRAVVCTSATLRVAGTFTHMIERLGLTAELTEKLDSPFADLARNQLVVLLGHLPLPRGMLLEEFGEATTGELARLFTLSSGGAMALFTARDRMLRSRDHLKPLLAKNDMELLCQGDQAATKLVERMRTDEGSCLLGTRSFWEGVDIPGDALRLLAIEKLPFPNFSDPLVAARTEELQRRGKDPFQHYVVPQAVLAFAQGAGRLIRTEDDRGALVLLDKRLRMPLSYSSAFLDALPDGTEPRRPNTAEEAYEAIAEHLGLAWGSGIAETLAALPSAGTSKDFTDLAIRADQRRDRTLIRQRLEQVRERMDIGAWRLGQQELIEQLLGDERADVLAVLPTGSGKSLIYQIPGLLLPGITLVTSPLLALMRDQIDGLRQRGYHQVAAIHTGQSQTEQNEVLTGVREGRYKLLYVSPERLWTTRFREAMEGVAIDLVVVDEAHCVSLWGHSFRPEYLQITRAITEMCDARAEIGRPVLAALTGTATPQTQADIIEQLRLRLPDGAVAHNPDRPELRFYVQECKSFEDRKLQVLAILGAFRNKPAIVYVPRRRDTMHLSALLRADNHVCLPYHGGMEQPQRTHTEEAFRHGEVDVIVGTNAFGLGIDKPDVELVVHLEMPQTIEDYVQETGRAARGTTDGRGPEIGTCILLRTPRDCGIHNFFGKNAVPSFETVRSVWQRLSGRSLIPLGELSRSADENEREHTGLAVQYLVVHGAAQRRPDVTWRCTVNVPQDWRGRLARANRLDDAERALLNTAVESWRRFGGEPFNLVEECERRAWEPADTERLLLKADRCEIITFRTIEPALDIVCASEHEPDWEAIQEALDEQGRRIGDRIRRAREFARSDETCRRARMLSYLGVDAPPCCEGCDVCVPDMPRPWAGHEFTPEQLEHAIPAREVVRVLLSDVAGAKYSRANILRTLSDTGGPYELPAELKSHHLRGALAHLSDNRIEETIAQMVADGMVEEFQTTRHPDEGSGPYSALRLR